MAVFGQKKIYRSKRTEDNSNEKGIFTNLPDIGNVASGVQFAPSAGR